MSISPAKLQPTVKQLKRILAYETPDVITGIVATAMLLIELDRLTEGANSTDTLKIFTDIFNALKGAEHGISN